MKLESSQKCSQQSSRRCSLDILQLRILDFIAFFTLRMFVLEASREMGPATFTFQALEPHVKKRKGKSLFTVVCAGAGNLSKDAHNSSSKGPRGCFTWHKGGFHFDWAWPY